MQHACLVSVCYRGRMILGLGLLLLGIVVLVRWVRGGRRPPASRD